MSQQDPWPQVQQTTTWALQQQVDDLRLMADLMALGMVAGMAMAVVKEVFPPGDFGGKTAHIGGGTLAGMGKVFRLRANPETGTRFYVAEAAYG